MYFGEKWDSPYLDEEEDREIHRIATPVGATCFHCKETIGDGDRGLLCQVMSDRPLDGEARGEPIHAECNTLLNVGSPAHLRNQCLCAGKREPKWRGTLREEALATIAIVNERRAAVGMGPLW